MPEQEDRIYIGGLDPPRLTAQHVLDRLPKEKGIEILSMESDPDKAYCHVRATASGEESALQIIFATFNNVKWKGCRLTVQAARPHFLERLEQERQERRAILKGKEEPRQVDANTEAGEVAELKSAQIPRRLRVRKKFGDAAFHVDTKPWEVESWPDFSRAVGKQRKRLENQQFQNSEKDVSVPLMHRAVHIRFSGEAVAKTVDKDLRSGSLSLPNHGAPTIVDASDINDDLESEESSKTSRSEAEQRPGYTWSDDDESSDADESKMKASASEVSDESDADDEVVDIHERNDRSGEAVVKNETNAGHGTMIQETYQWSSDEESSEDEDTTGARDKRDMSLRPVTQSDEFAAGLDIGEGDIIVGNQEQEWTDVTVPAIANPDLKNDVTSNLGILSSLFPEVEGTKPVIVESESDCTKSNDASKPLNHSGFGAGGIMLRYDPTDTSSHKFEIQEAQDGKNVNDEKDIESSPALGPEESEEAVGIDPSPASQDAGAKETIQIYEEKRLEDVFRQAREGWKGEAADTDNTHEAHRGGSFAFGFELGPPKTAPKKSPNTGFSFGFDIQAPEKDAMLQGDPIESEGQIDINVSSKSVLTNEQALAPEKRIRGSIFPESDLESYTARFYSLNNGNDIIQNFEAYRRDPKVKEEWKKERYTLTLDWKRKRKHAQTRIQKKMKIR